MQSTTFSISLAAVLILSVAACHPERSGDAITLNGTGLLYRGGRMQVRDVSRRTTFGLLDSPALDQWTSDDHLFRDKSPDCLILLFDVGLRGTLVQAADPHTTIVLDGDRALVRADELSLTRLNRADADRRVREMGVEAPKDRSVCASS